jgi:Fe-Mn family superoxide dismutase
MKSICLYFLFLIGCLEASSYTPSSLPALGVEAEYHKKDYSYLLGKLSGISDPLLEMHFTLYSGYVKNTNSLAAALRDMRMKGEDLTLAYGALKRRFAWEYDGMYLHELYFGNLGGKASLSPKSSLYQKIVLDYGSYKDWEKNFKATGLIRGVGWVILYQDPLDGFLYNIWVDEHHINHMAGGAPLLVMDVWEHAYITQFGLDRGKYIDAFFENIDWGVIEKRFADQNPMNQGMLRE